MTTWEQSKKQKRLETLPQRELLRLFSQRALAVIQERPRVAPGGKPAKEALPERRSLIAALENSLTLLRGAEDEAQSESGAKESGAEAPAAAQRPYAGQAEYGDAALREQIPAFPYWEEHKALGSRRLDKSALLRPTGELRIEETSRRDFELGPPESAWAGLLQLAACTRAQRDLLFLIPLAQEDAALRAVRYTRKRVAARSVRSGLLSPHAAAVHALAQEKRLAREQWNQIDAGFLKQSERYHQAGCFLGCFVVKSATGMYLNFTCASLNPFATGVYGPAPRNPEAMTTEQSVAWNNYVNVGDAITPDDVERLKSVQMHRFFIRPGGIEVPRAFAEEIVRVLAI